MVGIFLYKLSFSSARALKILATIQNLKKTGFGTKFRFLLFGSGSSDSPVTAEPDTTADFEHSLVWKVAQETYRFEAKK